jgi:hypothetical protein
LDENLKPRFKLELSLSTTATHFTVAETTLIHEQVISQAWNLMNVFAEDVLDQIEVIDATDEQFREVFIEICYRLIFREMTTLLVMPISERNVMNRIMHPKPKNRCKGEQPWKS